MAKKEPPQTAETGLDDDDIIDLLEVVKPGNAVATNKSGSMDDFSSDLDTMLENLEKQEKAASVTGQPFPDPTPVDYAVDHNEALDLPSMNDLDSLLESLGAAPANEEGPDADASPAVLGAGDISDALDSFAPYSEAGDEAGDGAGDDEPGQPGQTVQDDLVNLADLGDTMDLSFEQPSVSVAMPDDDVFDLGIAAGAGASFVAALGVNLDDTPDKEDTSDKEDGLEAIEPDANEPDTSELGESGPEEISPGTIEQDVVEAEASQPEDMQLDAIVPEEIQLDAIVPEEMQPNAFEPDTMEPDASGEAILDSAQPEEAPDTLALDDNPLLAGLDYAAMDDIPADDPKSPEPAMGLYIDEEGDTMPSSLGPERDRKEIMVDVDDLPETATGPNNAELPDFSDIAPDYAQVASALSIPVIPGLPNTTAEQTEIPGMPETPVTPARLKENAQVNTIDEDLNELDAILDDMISSSLTTESADLPAQAMPNPGNGEDDSEFIDVTDNYAMILRLENLENTLEYQLRQHQLMLGDSMATLEPRLAALENLLEAQQKRIETLETNMEKMVAATAAKVIREEIEGLIQSMGNGGA